MCMIGSAMIVSISFVKGMGMNNHSSVFVDMRMGKIENVEIGPNQREQNTGDKDLLNCFFVLSHLFLDSELKIEKIPLKIKWKDGKNRTTEPTRCPPGEVGSF